MKSTILELKQVSLKIAGVDKPILNHIDYQVYKNDFIVILGSNGSGKSSLLKLVDRRYQASAGIILLNNQPHHKFSPKEFSRKITTITQRCEDSLFTSLTLFENFLLVKSANEDGFYTLNKKIERDYLSTYLEEFNPNLASKLDHIVDKLSGGEKQALVLALSVLYPPQILLLDEHTSALDPKSAQQLMQITHSIITKHQITCLLTTHDLHLAMRYGNRILALRQGDIYKMIGHNKKLTVSHQELLAACY